MKIESLQGDLSASNACEAVVVGLTSDKGLDRLGQQIDEALGGWLTDVLTREEIAGKPSDVQMFAAPQIGDDQALASVKTIVVVGLGDTDSIGCGIAHRAGGAAIRLIASRPRTHVLFGFAENLSPEIARSAVAGAVAGVPGQDLYREEQKLTEPLQISWLGVSEETVFAGAAIGQGICVTKRLVNEPPNVIYPESFATEGQRLAAECGFDIEIWDKPKLVAENCNAILAVSAGSAKDPRLVMFRHNGGPADEAPIAIVGKGVTFDSGGLSIKPSEGMKDMKCDMGGAATVLGTMVAASRLGIKKNIIGLVGLAENMLSGSSYKLGDVIHSRNGKTIEILNTDAEGRVVLADTLDVAVENEPSNIIDLATLTGACLVALGVDVVGAMTNDAPWCDQLKAAAEHEDERVWELPMWDFYGDQIKSKVADIKNIGEGRWGGAITAGKFLEEFVGDVPWIHLDIAGPAYADSPKPWRDAGGTGAMVRTLVRLLETA